MENQTITIKTSVNAPVARVWEVWSNPEDIKQWSVASPDWHTPRAENDLRAGGAFNNRMEAKDGSFGFDFTGVYDEVTLHELIVYTMGDGRKVVVHFKSNGDTTDIIETFEAENTNPLEMQRNGWQAMLDNFKRYVETDNN